MIPTFISSDYIEACKRMPKLPPTDTSLKQALAKMLPEVLKYDFDGLAWKSAGITNVRDTELLHLCWLVEETLPIKSDYMKTFYYEPAFDKVCDDYDGTCWTAVYAYAHATWQQRVTALCKVKGVEIV